MEKFDISPAEEEVVAEACRGEADEKGDEEESGDHEDKGRTDQNVEINTCTDDAETLITNSRPKNRPTSTSDVSSCCNSGVTRGSSKDKEHDDKGEEEDWPNWDDDVNSNDEGGEPKVKARIDTENNEWPDWDSDISSSEDDHQTNNTKITDFFKSKGSMSGGNRGNFIDARDVPGASTDTPATTKKRVKDVRKKAKKRALNDSNDSAPSKRVKNKFDKKHFSWELVKEMRNKRFDAQELLYDLKFDKDLRGGVGNILNAMGEMLETFLQEIKSQMQTRDFVRLVIISPELREAIGLPWAMVQDLDVEAILELIEKVLQSNQQFYLHSGVRIVVRHVKNPKGGKGGAAHKILDNDAFCAAKRGIIRVKNKNDELCFAKAIIKGIYRENGPLKHPQMRSIQNENDILMTLAQALHQKAGVPEGKVSLSDMSKFQEVLYNDYPVKIRLLVYSMRYANAIIYDGATVDPTVEDSDEGWEPLFLYHYDEHYNVIASITSFVGTSYFCYKCLKGYDKRKDHICEGYCSQCRTFLCDGKILDYDENRSLWKKCDDCRRTFKTDLCFQQHKGNSTCKNIYICEECGKFVDGKRLPKGQKEHCCTDYFCTTCNEWVQEDHTCFMLPSDLPDGDPECKIPEKYIFYDFECQQDTGVHVPNLVVARWTCTDCLDISENDPNRQTKVDSCNLCSAPQKDREKHFKGVKAANDFCTWLFEKQPNQYKLNKKGKETSSPAFRRTVIAHNSQSYDLYFVMQHMLKNGRTPDRCIRRGGKLLYVTRRDDCIRFIDSLCFLPMALSKLSSAFDLDEPKGFFCHYFNVPDNEGFKGNLPEDVHYGPGKMMPKTRAEFYKWYNEEAKKGGVFDFDAELLKYCRLDVHILEQACVKFRKLFMSITSMDDYKGIDPFKHSVTLAAACNLVYRSLYLKPETIALLPPQGFQPEKAFSVKALQWLHYESVTRNCHIRHACNGGEVKIGGHYVDGWCEDTRTVFEYFGCIWHGCKCMGPQTKNKINQKSMSTLYQHTMKKLEKLKNIPGVTVVHIWEHEFDKKLSDKKSNAREIVADANTVSPINPRAAFFGGRCNALKLFHEAEGSEQIKYRDFISLYPTCNKKCRYPIGFPQIIHDNFDPTIDNYFGLIHCDILPPVDLYLPVLPCKPPSGKLTFALCSTCANTEQQTPCEHTDGERVFRGVWVSEELKKAVELGYTVVKIHEVWHFEESTQYDPETKEGGLFAEYINQFLKVKQEASGWPEGVSTDEEKDRYIREYFENEDIELDKDKIKHNPGLRTVAKLCLNTLWGKFGQSENMPKTEFISNPARVLELLGDRKYEVDDLIFHNESMCEAHFSVKGQFAEASVNTNVIIAAFTTAWARLKLYSVLEQLGSRALYLDTDSVVYHHKEGEYEPPVGSYLGCLTDEIDPKDGNYIKTFVSGGPKSYGYQLDTGKTNLKIRGITLNHDAVKIINFDTLKEMVQPHSSLKSVRVPLPGQITRDTKNKVILNKDTHKDYRVVYTKRVLQPNGYDTLPYGYRK